MRQSVELILAFEWSCEKCGSRNYASGVTMSREEAAELGDEDEPGYYMQQPDEVECNMCGEIYDTEQYDDLNGEQEG